ncbi:hypothetical protein Tco_1368771 [Tanacetum coccineum]
MKRDVQRAKHSISCSFARWSDTKPLILHVSILDGGYDGPLSIGLEGHFRHLNIPYMRSVIHKAAELDQSLIEAHAHPSVNAIVLWSAWSPKGYFRMFLTYNLFRNLPTCDVVDRFIGEFSGAVVTATKDVNGFYETKLIHGDYEVTFKDCISSGYVANFGLAKDRGGGCYMRISVFGRAYILMVVESLEMEVVKACVLWDVEKVGDLSLEAMEDEEVAMVDGVFEGAFSALGDEMEALVDTMEVMVVDDE